MQRWLFLLCLGIVLATAVRPMHAQGCSQCRDTVSQTNPGVQASYRTGILIMISAVTGIAATAGLVLRRMR